MLGSRASSNCKRKSIAVPAQIKIFNNPLALPVPLLRAELCCAFYYVLYPFIVGAIPVQHEAYISAGGTKGVMQGAEERYCDED